MARTWNDTAATLRGLATLIPDLDKRTAAIAVTGQGDGTWLIDEAGHPTAPAMLWLDARAAEIVDGIRGSPQGRAIFERTGAGVNVCQQGSQLLWLKKHHPEVLARSATALHCKDWLYFNLTGRSGRGPSESIFTFGNIATRQKDAEVIVRLGLESEARLLPPIVDGVRQLGRLSEAAAQEIGFEAGLPVVLGYVDVVCTALGAGLFDRETATGCTIIGSTGMHMRYARVGFGRDVQRRLHRLHHGVPGRERLRPAAIQHGLHHQHRLAARSRARRAQRLQRRDLAQGPARRRRCARARGRARAACSSIPTSPKPANADPSSIPRPGRSSSACRPATPTAT